MKAESESILESERVNEAVAAIEQRKIQIGDSISFLRVLSIHPAPSGDEKDGVVFRLGLRSSGMSNIVVAPKNSFNARLYDVVITFPFNTNRKMNAQIDELIKVVVSEVTRMFDQTPERPVIRVQTSPIRFNALAALGAVAASFAGATVLSRSSPEAFNSTLLAALALGVYGIVSQIGRR